MKKLCSSSLLLLFTGAAFAAPLPPSNSLHSTWKGPYVGFNAGAAWASAGAQISTNVDGYLNASNAAAVNQAGKQTIHLSGFSTGIEAGYNWLLGKSWLLGLETDLEALHLSNNSNSGALPYPSFPADTFVAGAYVNSNWLFTLRPRIGYLVNHCLFYATAGLGVTQLHSNFYFTDTDAALESGSIDTTKVGPTLGAGVEFELSQKWSFKAEYLYVYFNNTNATETGSNLTVNYPQQVFNYSTNLRTSILRVGVNYRLDNLLG